MFRSLVLLCSKLKIELKVGIFRLKVLKLEFEVHFLKSKVSLVRKVYTLEY